MSETTESKPDSRTDAEKFNDAMRSILAAPKKEVMEQLAREKEERRAAKAKSEARQK